MAAEYKLCGTESERTGEVHTWIKRDGFNLELEDIHSDLLDLQQQVEAYRQAGARLYMRETDSSLEESLDEMDIEVGREVSDV